MVYVEGTNGSFDDGVELYRQIHQGAESYGAGSSAEQAGGTASGPQPQERLGPAEGAKG